MVYYDKINEYLENEKGYDLRKVYQQNLMFKLKADFDDVEELSECSLSKNMKYLYLNGEEIGELCLPFDSHFTHDNYRNRFDFAKKFLELSNFKYTCLVQCKYKNYYMLMVLIAIELPEKIDGELLKDLIPKRLEKESGNYIRRPIKTISTIWKSNIVPRIGEQVLILQRKNEIFSLNNIIIGRYDKSKTYLVSIISNTEHINEATGEDLLYCCKFRTYKAIVSDIRCYGKDIYIMISFAYYEIEEKTKTAEDYPKELIDVIPLSYNGRLRNKIRIWSIKPFEDTTLIPGTLLRFKNNGMGVAAVKNLSEKELKELGFDDISVEMFPYSAPSDMMLGYINDKTEIGGDNNYKNKYELELYEKNRERDMVYGVVLDEAGTIAYATYRKESKKEISKEI